MSPKEKAKELYEKFDNYPLTDHWKKECALICVDEVLKSILFYQSQTEYWEQVKQEIEKL